MAETELTDAQKAYNVAQSEVFQLAAYGHHRYHPSGEALTAEGKRQQRDYNDRLLKARANLEAALLRLVAEHGERYRTLPAPVVGWLRTLADDPAELSLLTLTPDELLETRGNQTNALACGCPDENAIEHGFGTPDCTCIPYTRQTSPPRILNRPTDTVDMISGWERGPDCPHHRS